MNTLKLRIYFSFLFLRSPKAIPHRRMSKSDSVPNLSSDLDIQQCSPTAERSPHRHRKHRRRSRASNSLVHRSTRESTTLLNPSAMMRMHKAAVSFDESGIYTDRCYRKESMMMTHGSPQGSVKFDLIPKVFTDEPHRHVRHRPKRSDTARRHVLARQKQIIGDDAHVHHSDRRPRTIRQSSYDPRLPVSSNEASPESKFKSEISVCSEPPPVLSGQSSIEAAVIDGANSSSVQEIPAMDVPTVEVRESSEKGDNDDDDVSKTTPQKLTRSSSTKSYKEKRKLETRRNNELARMFAMQSLRRAAENQNDIDVITERRSKLFSSLTVDHGTDSMDYVVDIPLEPISKSLDEHVIQLDTIVVIEPEESSEEVAAEKEVIK